MPEVRQPLFISSRLMAALKVEDAGTLHVGADGRTSEGRVRYAYVIEDVSGTVLDEDEFHSGVGDEVDYTQAMSTLLSFLTAAAESYRYGMGTGRPGENADLFPAPCVEWAYQNSDDLAGLELELTEEN